MLRRMTATIAVCVLAWAATVPAEEREEVRRGIQPPGSRIRVVTPSRTTSTGRGPYYVQLGDQSILRRATAEALLAREKVKVAYLGLTGKPVDPALTAHLDLPEGVGLLVEYVDPDGPAKAAGIQTHDVLHKLNEQVLVNFHQLAVLVRSFKPGQEVKLTLIRKAKVQTLPVKLVEKESPRLPPPPVWRPDEAPLMRMMTGGRGIDVPGVTIYTTPKQAVVAPFDGVLKDVAEPGQQVKKGQIVARLDTAELELKLKRLQAEAAGLEKELAAHKADQDAAQAQIVQAKMDELKARTEALEDRIKRAELHSPVDGTVAGEYKATVGAPVKAGNVLLEIGESWNSRYYDAYRSLAEANAAGRSFQYRLQFQDPDGSIAITRGDGQKHLVVKDPAGKVVFNGPIDTPEQRKAVPEPFRQKLEKMEDFFKLRLEGELRRR